MDLLRSGIKSMLGHSEPSPDQQPDVGETVECLAERLRTSSLLEDRRAACRQLRSLSKTCRLEVGAQCMHELVQVLRCDTADAELVGYALDTLCNVTAQGEPANGMAPTFTAGGGGGGCGEELVGALSGVNDDELGDQFTEIFIKTADNVHVLLGLLDHYEFRIRFPAVRLACNLLQNRPRQLQEIVMQAPQAVPRLMDLLKDTREVIRNDALIMLTYLTRANADIQKIVAFESAFDHLLDIIVDEGAAAGGIVVEDCLVLMLNLLRNNASNQSLFRDVKYIQRLSAFFTPLAGDMDAGDDVGDGGAGGAGASGEVAGGAAAAAAAAVGWSAQKVSNVHHMLQLVRTLVAPTNPRPDTLAAQLAMSSCRVLAQLCQLLMAAGVPADILTQTIATVGEVCRGCPGNQRHLAAVRAPTVPPRPVLIVLLMSMINERQQLQLRCAVLYCIQCYLYGNADGQTALIGTLLPETNGGAGSAAGEGDAAVQRSRDDSATAAAVRSAAADGGGGGGGADGVTSGSLLCNGLFASDPLSVWLSAVALSHALASATTALGRQLRGQLLRVQLAAATAAAGGSDSGGCAQMAVTGLLDQLLAALQHSASGPGRTHSRLGLLQLLASWTACCTPAANQLLQLPSAVPYLVAQLVNNESDDREQLCQGVCALIMGTCLLATDSSVAGFSRHQLLQLLERRVGVDTYLNKLALIGRHELYSQTLKHPQLSARERSEVALDHEFCRLYRTMETAVVRCVNMDDSDGVLLEATGVGSAVVSAAAAAGGGGGGVSAGGMGALSADCDLVTRYKHLIRQQDDQLLQLRQSEARATEQLAASGVQVAELLAQVEQLRDQVTLLKAQQSGVECPPVESSAAAAAAPPGTITGASAASHPTQQQQQQQQHQQLLATAVASDQTAVGYKHTQELAALRQAYEQQIAALVDDNARLSDQLTAVSHTDQPNISADSATAVAENQQLQLVIAEKQQLEKQLQLVTAENQQLQLVIAEKQQLEKQLQLLKGVEHQLQQTHSEQEDLLMLLTDQDSRIERYREQLRQLNVVVDDDDDQ